MATAVGGVPELLGGDIRDGAADGVAEGIDMAERGIIFPPGDGEGLARALSVVLSGGALGGEVIGRAREFALSNFGRERLVKDIENLYIKSLDMA